MREEGEALRFRANAARRRNTRKKRSGLPLRPTAPLKAARSSSPAAAGATQSWGLHIAAAGGSDNALFPHRSSYPHPLLGTTRTRLFERSSVLIRRTIAKAGAGPPFAQIWLAAQLEAPLNEHLQISLDLLYT